MAEEYTIVAGPMRHYFENDYDDLPVLDETVLREALAAVPQVEELDESGGELVLPTLVYQFDLFRGQDDQLRIVTGEMYYSLDLTETDIRYAFEFLTDLANRLGASLYEADEEGTLMTTDRVDETIRGNLKALAPKRP